MSSDAIDTEMGFTVGNILPKRLLEHSDILLSLTF